MAKFPIGTMILYGTDGVCTISQVVMRKFRSSSKDYYVLKPLYNETATIYIPVGNEACESKMRPVLSKSEILAVIDSLPGRDAMWIEDENDRKELYRDAISGGDRVQLIGIIKALYTRRRELEEAGKHLHAADERFFKEAERLLYDEFAAVLGLDKADVLPFILEKLEATE